MEVKLNFVPMILGPTPRRRAIKELTNQLNEHLRTGVTECALIHDDIRIDVTNDSVKWQDKNMRNMSRECSNELGRILMRELK